MKIGIRYQRFNEIFYILYAMRNGNLILDSNKDSYRKSFSIQCNDDTYVFTHEIETQQDSKDALEECDIVLLAMHNSECITNYRYKDYKEKNKDCAYFDAIILSSPGEALVHTISDDELISFLDAGNIFITGTDNLNINHKRLFIDKFMSPILLYYELGLNYINFYQNTKAKINLLGTYNRKVYINDYEGTPSNKSVVRNKRIEEVKNILGEDFVIYANNHKLFPEILEPYYFLTLWQNNHVSGYSDFATSVCNLIFESFTPDDTDCRTNLSEKTTKAILFSKENIFFIWHGPDKLFHALRDMGFWFFNMEFYNFENPQKNEMDISMFLAIEYLKNLKQIHKENNLVFEHMLVKYNEKLVKNYMLFEDRLVTCPITDNILNCIHNLIEVKNEFR